MSSNNYLDSDFADYVQSLLDEYHVPGIAVAVINGGKFQTEGYGLARFPDVPATSETLWWAGSTTKSMVAAVAGMLVHDPSKIRPDSKIKKVEWTTPLVEILGEDFKLPDPYMTANVTLEDALSHRSGLPGHENCYGNWQGPAPRDMTRRARYLGPEKTPMRSKIAYNNIMYAVAADAIETLTGMTIGEALQKYIWIPLGMNNTFWGIEGYAEAEPTRNSPHLSRGYQWIDKTTRASSAEANPESANNGYYVAGPYCALCGLSAAGANVTSIEDYAKWVTELLRASKMLGKSAGSKEESENSSAVISPKLFKDLTTARTLIQPPFNFFPQLNPMPENPQLTPDYYALGWYNNPRMYPGTHIVTHAGGLDTYGAEVHLVPELDFGVTTMGNTAFTSNLVGCTIVKELLGLKLGKSLEERRPGMTKDTKADTKEAASEDNKSTVVAITEPLGEDQMQKDIATAIPLVPPPESFAVTTAPIKSQDLESCTGSYFNGAYGEYSVTLLPSSEANLSTNHPTLKSKQIIRKQDLSAYNNPSGDRSPVLQAHPVGHRTWIFTLLIHATGTKPTPKSQTASGFLTLEKLNTFGDLTHDPIPGYTQSFGPSTLPEKSKSECRDEVVHLSTDIVPRGACFVVTHENKIRMGMVLVRQSLERIKAKSGEKKEGKVNEEESEEMEEGWEDGMIWFDKI